MSYKVSFNTPERVLGKSDIIFRIKENGEKYGTLRVSKGAVVWVGKNKKYGHRLRWQAFADVMNENGNLERKRTIQRKSRRTKGR